MDAAVLKLHSRRCTCLEFHPFKDNLVLSGDKKGQASISDLHAGSADEEPDMTGRTCCIAC